jgi:hypothetical protein
MNVKEAVDYVSSRFRYLADKKLIYGDSWFVMDERDGVMRGDCDDFAITCLWLICDRNIFKFILNVLILHRYRMYFSISPNKENHIVGYAKGLWFDNWSLSALPKEEFLKKTKHKIKLPYFSPIIVVFLLIGLFYRKRYLKHQ